MLFLIPAPFNTIKNKQKSQLTPYTMVKLTKLKSASKNNPVSKIRKRKCVIEIDGNICHSKINIHVRLSGTGE